MFGNFAIDSPAQMSFLSPGLGPIMGYSPPSPLGPGPSTPGAGPDVYSPGNGDIPEIPPPEGFPGSVPGNGILYEPNPFQISANNNGQIPAPATVASTDYVQWATDNWLLLVLGGILLIGYLQKKKRKTTTAKPKTTAKTTIVKV